MGNLSHSMRLQGCIVLVVMSVYYHPVCFDALEWAYNELLQFSKIYFTTDVKSPRKFSIIFHKKYKKQPWFSNI